MINSSILDLEVYTVPCDLELVCPQWHTFGMDYLIPLERIVGLRTTAVPGLHMSDNGCRVRRSMQHHPRCWLDDAFPGKPLCWLHLVRT